jgi:PAS domain S-box-containing protein
MWSALGAPLVKNGQLIAVLLLADTSPRKWSDEEIALLKEVAERLWATTERAHVEAVLRESEAKYRSLFTSMNDGFCIVELIYNEQQQPIDYLFLEANAAFEQQAGLSQPIGKTGLYFAPNHEPEILANYHQVAVTGKPIEFEITMADLGRSFRASTNRHGDPHKRQVAIVFNDITERKCREASQALLAEVTERLAGLSDIDETMEQLGETIGGHFGVKYCMFAEHTDEFETAIAYGWNDADVPAIGGTYRMRDFLADAELAAILTGKPLIVSDTQTDARVSAESYGALNIHSFIIVPLLRDRQWQFQISIIDNKPRTWRDDEVELMRELTRRIWASLERARAEAATIADLHDTQLLRELATRLVIEGDIQTLYQEIISTAIALTHADAGTVQILDNKTQDLLLLATQGLDRTLIEQNARVDASSISPCGIALRNGERSFVDFDVPDEDPDGSMRMYVEAGYLSAQSTPLISRSGRAIGMVSTHWRKQRRPSDRELRFLDLLARQAADLIEQRQFEQALRLSESRFRLIMESAKDYAIFTLNLNGVVTSWNAGAENLLGYTESEIIGRNGRIIFTPEDIEQGKPAREMQLAQTQGRAENERWHVRQDGSSFWGSGLMMPLQDETGTMQGFVKIMQDKTAERQSAAEREQLLQQEQIARAEADRANSIKDQFLAVLSHELRTPLNPILGWTRLLQTGRLPEARQREALERIERNAKLQIQLIEDLLDISRIMRGKLSLTVADVSLTSVITSAVETVRLAADAKQIQILLDLPTEIAPVSGDEARLQQVVWNLLSNAVKFTPNGGRVIVELRQLEGLAQIRVIDTGKGIDPEFLPYVFEYFRQEDSSTTRKFGGLGLGLAIVRQIVEMHGGTVGVESLGEDRGATFIVELPVIRQAAATGFQPSQSPVENLEECLNNLQILLVDDEVDTLEYQAFLLEESGAKVVAVASSSEALQELERFIPDVLISDIGMAEMDGYMLIQEIRDRPPEQGGTIPAIAVTAYAQDFDRQTAFESGFQAHITKPVEPEELIKTILKVNAS